MKQKITRRVCKGALSKEDFFIVKEILKYTNEYLGARMPEEVCAESKIIKALQQKGFEVVTHFFVWRSTFQGYEMWNSICEGRREFFFPEYERARISATLEKQANGKFERVSHLFLYGKDAALVATTSIPLSRRKNVHLLSKEAVQLIRERELQYDK